jgi:hypothetical protein
MRASALSPPGVAPAAPPNQSATASATVRPISIAPQRIDIDQLAIVLLPLNFGKVGIRP